MRKCVGLLGSAAGHPIIGTYCFPVLSSVSPVLFTESWDEVLGLPGAHSSTRQGCRLSTTPAEDALTDTLALLCPAVTKYGLGISQVVFVNSLMEE